MARVAEDRADHWHACARRPISLSSADRFANRRMFWKVRDATLGDVVRLGLASAARRGR
jgi:hypothetical protein